MKLPIAFACLVLTASPALAVPYTFTALPTGFTAVGINDSGVIAGNAPSNGQLLPAVLANGVLTFPKTPQSNGTATSLAAINDAGDLLGSTQNGRSPFLLSNGTVVPFAAPGNTASGTQAYGLNDKQQVVGSTLVFTGTASVPEAYVSSGSSYIVIASGFPGVFVVPSDINNLGVVVGSTGFAPGNPTRQAFVYQNGAVTDFGVPGGYSDTAVGINDSGEIAGQYSVIGGSDRGYTRIGGVFSDIVGPGGAFFPVALNDAGQLVGTFGGTGPSYLATPVAAAVPEPPAMLLLGGMLLLIVVVRWRYSTPVAVLAAMVVTPLAAGAVPIVYTFVSPNETGSLNGVSFTNAIVTYTATADTADIKEMFEVPFTASRGMQFFGSFATVPLASLVVSVGGLQPAALPAPVTLRFVYGSRDLTFTISSGFSYFGTVIPMMPTDPDLLASFTPVPIMLPNAPFMGTTPTTQGSFTAVMFANVSTTFTARPGPAAAFVPEPGSGALIGTGLLCLIVAGMARAMRSPRWSPRGSSRGSSRWQREGGRPSSPPVTAAQPTGQPLGHPPGIRHAA